MAVNKKVVQTVDGYSVSAIGANSAAFGVGDFVSYSGGYVTPSTAGVKIEGVSNSTKTFDSDNITVDKDTLSYTKATPSMTVVVEISGGTITQADEGKYYNLTDANTVDGTTESANESYIDTTSAAAVDPVVKYQLRLVDFVSSTSGKFAVVL